MAKSTLERTYIGIKQRSDERIIWHALIEREELRYSRYGNPKKFTYEAVACSPNRALGWWNSRAPRTKKVDSSMLFCHFCAPLHKSKKVINPMVNVRLGGGRY